jgi:hypothetical protein
MAYTASDSAHIVSCSNHSSHFNGCEDCYNAQAINLVIGKIRVKHGIHHIQIDHGSPGAQLQMARQHLQKSLHRFFIRAGKAAGEAAKVRADEVLKATEDELDAIAAAANKAIDWEEIVDETIAILREANGMGGKDGIAQLAIKASLVPDMEAKVEAAALVYAKDRAAEMIGKKYVDDELIGDSNAEFVISDTTREDIKDIVENAFEQNMSSSQLKTAIEEATTFGPERAELIAKTEVALAQVQGNLAVWKETGLVKTVNIVLSANHYLTDECDVISDGGPYPINEMPFIPAHPRCQCVIVAAEINET